MCERCKEKLLDFIDTSLNGDLDKLKDFDFTELGKQYKRDCDRLSVVNAIYCLLYSKQFNLTTCLVESDLFNPNCGDTLNTYKSSFGNGAAGKRARSLINKAQDKSLESLLKKFELRYHTIGNFMPLPTKTINRISINTARNSAANDYADLFFTIVKDYYDLKLNEHLFLQKYTANHQRKGVQNLAIVMVKNISYFEIFKTFCNFIKENYLEPFYKDGHFPLFNHTLEEVHFKNVEDIKNYLANSIAIIEERSNILVDALKGIKTHL